MNPNVELLAATKGLMIAVGEQMERESLMPYLRRRAQPLEQFDLEWNPQPVVFRAEEFLRRARISSVVLVPERFVQHVRASKRICEIMDWADFGPHIDNGLLGHLSGIPVYSDHKAMENSRNPKDKFLFVGAKYGTFAYG